MKPIMPTGKYSKCKYWAEILTEANKRSHLKFLVKRYEQTKHPACLNSIMDNGDANLWLTYHTGRIFLKA